MTDDLDLRDRDRLLVDLTNEVFDILVIGGGITGAGVARDAALRGYRVALVDAADFGAGTSSRSTKLIHGGLRYLAQGRIGLVRESARERRILAEIAPHLAQPVPMVVTARSWLERQKLRVGVAAFERLGKVPVDQRHDVWSNKALERAEPCLNTERLSGAVAYMEYRTDDAKLVLGNIRSADAAGATVANYMLVKAILKEAGQPLRAVLGAPMGSGEEMGSIRAKVIVNAAGPWVDPVRQMESPDAASNLVLTKGIHLVFDHAHLPINRAIMMKTPDNRSAFAVPRGAHVYLGTTDTFYADPDLWPSVTADDVDYLLGAANLTFDGRRLERSDIKALWAGLRPLVADPGKSPSEISRKDEMWIGPEGVITIAGGKLTAYRRMAERVVDVCAERLGGAARCSTHERLLPGGDRSPAEITAGLVSSGLEPRTAERLVQLYGTEAKRVWADGGDAAAEVRQAVTREGAIMLEDWWYRRSARAWFDPADDVDALRQGANAMAALLGWDPVETDRQVAAVHSRAATDRAVVSGDPLTPADAGDSP